MSSGLSDIAAEELLGLGLDTISSPKKSLGLGRGRRAAEFELRYDRDLTVEDLLAGATETGFRPPPLKELRDSHHRLARCLAQGLEQNEVAAITGYSPSRISILKSDPTFAELLTYYESMEKAQYGVARADMHERLSALGFDAIETLHMKLLDKPDSFDPKTLLAVVEATSDRTGHSKQVTVNQNVSFGVSDETLARIRTAAEVPGRALAPEDRRALVRYATERTALDNSEVETADWIEGTGRLVREEGAAAAEEPLADGEGAGVPVVPLR